MMYTQGFLISAANKSSGKTTLTVGLCATLTDRGLAVQPFKKGPDYIDPMWLAQASARPCFNLDYHTQTDEEITNQFYTHAGQADIAIVEGSKGLFDGVDPSGGNCTAALAELLSLPVVLVIDTYGITRGIAPLLLGYQSFAGAVPIAGVILNKVGGARHEEKLRQAAENYTDIPVLGAIGRHRKIEIAERHLGLIPTNETAEAETLISSIRDVVQEGVDVDRLLELAAALPAEPSANDPAPSNFEPLRIAIAQDAAFGFYYPDDLAAFEAGGAELVAFDTMKDTRLPHVDGLFIGGGFPENHIKALEANHSLRREICAAIKAGLPAYAECGGLLYLARSLENNGVRGDMAGVIPADGVMNEKPIGRGYV
ncbi:MAG: cobyrinate a,c-diamide synthase, partial [Rhodospirillales bacterium]|nr:cobyrinate a,c-diamide synthase [Rhodospirillales bacterium]